MIAILLAVFCATALAATEPRVVTPGPLAHGWVRGARADATTDIKFVVKVRPQNVHVLHQIAEAVSDPKSPQYTKYLTAEEVNTLVAPSEADTAAVVAWLTAQDVTLEHTGTGAITVRTKVAAAERLLNTEFYTLSHKAHRQSRVRAHEYTIPASVSGAVAAVFGLHGLPLPPKARKPVGDAPTIIPGDLLQAYNVAGVTPAGTTANRQAVAEFQGELMSNADLQQFFSQYVPNAPASDAQVYAFHGNPGDGDGIEAQLDIQYIMGVAPGILTEFYEQMDQDFCSDVQAWTTLLLNTTDIPLVHSVSYGWQGNLSELGCLDSEVQVIDVDFASLAARGISLIISSGDSGSGYTPVSPPDPPQCNPFVPGKKNLAFNGNVLHSFKFNNTEGALLCCAIARDWAQQKKFAGWTFVPGANNRGVCSLFSTILSNSTKAGAVSGPWDGPQPMPDVQVLWPSWPASSPWVTSVGATRFTNDVKFAPEMAVTEEDYFGSGGGFSYQFPQASYQSSYIAQYFQNVNASTLPPSNWYPATGRGTPDVSALGTGFSVISDGSMTPVGGTSASAPTFAALISLINDARIQAGKKQLGFLNSFLYQNQAAFTDITVGSDEWARGGGTLPYGFVCAKGWDPITGLGTPNFGLLLQAALALP